MVSRARLGVRCRYRDDIRLDSRYAKIGWQWCHVLVSASVGPTATTGPPRPAAAKEEGTVDPDRTTQTPSLPM